MHQLLDRVRMSVVTTGAGSPLTLGPAIEGFQSFDDANTDPLRDVPYVIEDGFAWEICEGRYTAAGTLLTRTTLKSSAGGTTPIDLTGNAQVFVSPMTATLLGRQTIGVPAAAMTAVDSRPASPAREETPTNQNMLLSYVFPQGLDRAVQFEVPMPASWNVKPLVARFRLRAPVVTTGTCRFQIRAVALKDGTPADIGFGTPVSVDTVVPGTAGSGFFTAETPEFTVANGPAHPCDVQFEIMRLGASEPSGPAGDVDLLSARIDYVTNSVTDTP